MLRNRAQVDLIDHLGSDLWLVRYASSIHSLLKFRDDLPGTWLANCSRLGANATSLTRSDDWSGHVVDMSAQPDSTKMAALREMCGAWGASID